MKKSNDMEREIAIRRRAMKRWLRAQGVSVPEWAIYNENALRKLVRNHYAKET